MHYSYDVVLFSDASATILSEVFVHHWLIPSPTFRSFVHRPSNPLLPLNNNTHFYVQINVIEWRRSKQTVDWGGKLQLTSSSHTTRFARPSIDGAAGVLLDSNLFIDPRTSNIIKTYVWYCLSCFTCCGFDGDCFGCCLIVFQI